MNGKLDGLLTRALTAGVPKEAAPDRTAFVADLAAALADAARMGAAEAVAAMPKPSAGLPAPRTAWRFTVNRKDGLIVVSGAGASRRFVLPPSMVIAAQRLSADQDALLIIEALTASGILD